MLDEDPLLAEVDALKAERDELKDRFMRSLADAENIRKRGDATDAKPNNMAGQSLPRICCRSLTTSSRALDAAGEEQRAAAQALIEGVELTMRELINVLTRHGVVPITPEVGESFDPQMHQAMFEAPMPGTKAGDIIQVMTEGFLLHDRLLRPAQVGVSSTPKS